MNHGPKEWGYDQESCNSACKDYTYYALQDYGWCACGNDYSTKAKFVKKPDSECGGPRGLGRIARNAIYKTCHINYGKIILDRRKFTLNFQDQLLYQITLLINTLDIYTIEHEETKECNRGDLITNDDTCKEACKRMNIKKIGDMTNQLSLTAMTDPCYKSEDGVCKRDGKHGLKDRLICKSIDFTSKTGSSKYIIFQIIINDLCNFSNIDIF